MAVITIDKSLEEVLKEIARQRAMTLDAIAREALLSYIQARPWETRNYSFVGIGRSGRGDLSTSVDEILAKNANRQEGWSL